MTLPGQAPPKDLFWRLWWRDPDSMKPDSVQFPKYLRIGDKPGTALCTRVTSVYKVCANPLHSWSSYFSGGKGRLTKGMKAVKPKHRGKDVGLHRQHAFPTVTHTTTCISLIFQQSALTTKSNTLKESGPTLCWYSFVHAADRKTPFKTKVWAIDESESQNPRGYKLFQF